jgi:hypothetical protein
MTGTKKRMVTVTGFLLTLLGSRVDSALFLILSMILIACSLYLPEHVTTISRRVFYYIAGDVEGAPTSAIVAATKETLTEVVEATVRPVSAQGAVEAAKAAAGVEA